MKTIEAQMEERSGDVEGELLKDLQERDRLAYERGRAKALLDANEVLHRFAMQTKDTNTLDLIESMQKEILQALTNQ